MPPMPVTYARRVNKVSMQEISRKQLVTTAEAGFVLGMSSQTVVNYCRQGVLDFSRVGKGRRMVSHGVLTEFMRAHGIENIEYRAAMHSSPYSAAIAAMASRESAVVPAVDHRAFDNSSGIPSYIDDLDEDQARMVLLNIQNAFNDKSRGNAFRVRRIAEAIANG